MYYCANELNQYDTLDDTMTCPPPGADVMLGDDLDGNPTGKGGLMRAPARGERRRG